MVEVGRAGVLSVNQLADRLNLDKSTASRVSDKLVLDGKLLRQEDPNDRRYVVLKLTKQGMQSYTNLEQRMNAYFEQVMAGVDPAERAAMLRGLQTLAAALNPSTLRGAARHTLSPTGTAAASHPAPRATRAPSALPCRTPRPALLRPCLRNRL